MLKIKELTTPDKYKEFIGLSFSYSEQIEHPMFGLQNHYKEISTVDGEIQYASLVKGNISMEHDIYTGIDIYKDKNENWEIVEEILSSFLELSKEDYELIMDNLKYDSIGFNLAEKVLDNKIDNLSKQLTELNSIKENCNLFNESKKEQGLVKKLVPNKRK